MDFDCAMFNPNELSTQTSVPIPTTFFFYVGISFIVIIAYSYKQFFELFSYFCVHYILMPIYMYVYVLQGANYISWIKIDTTMQGCFEVVFIFLYNFFDN